ncbi:MAG TPA: DUF308 domain-containing protein [Stellaceae bacterium]|nr:DUF308 domain-containing protein [Stellaceae bacterium]
MLRQSIDIFGARMGRGYRFFYLAEGAVLVVLGVIAISLPSVAGPAATRDLGWLFLGGGAVGLVATLATPHAPGFKWSLPSSALALITGAALVWDPAAGVIGLSLLLILFFLIDGALMLALAIEHRRESSPRWTWIFAGGVLDFCLGGAFIAGMPHSFTWAPSVLVGFDLLVGGIGLIAMAIAARQG